MTPRISGLLSKLRKPKTDETWFVGYGRYESDKPLTIHWVTARDVKTKEVLKSVPCLSTGVAENEKVGFERMRASGDEVLQHCVIQIEPLAGGRKPRISRAA